MEREDLTRSSRIASTAATSRRIVTPTPGVVSLNVGRESA
jgi:hypothetical protein